jgi:hypothetical protein
MRFLSLIKHIKQTYEAGLLSLVFPQIGRVEVERQCGLGHSVDAATKRCSYGHRIAWKREHN